MIIICSWCNTALGEKPPLEDLSITHGICKECADRMRAEAETFKKEVIDEP